MPNSLPTLAQTLREALQEATPPPWYVMDDPDPKHLPLISRCIQGSIPGIKDGRQGLAWTVGMGDPKDKANATLITTLVNLAPKLVEVLEAGQEVSARADDLLSVHDQWATRSFERQSDNEECLNYAEEKLRDALTHYQAVVRDMVRSE